QAEGGQRDELDRGQEEQQGGGLGDEQRGAVDRREQHALDAALLALRGEQAAHAEHRGEQERDPQDAGRYVALDRVAVEAEMEQRERRDREQRHSGNGLARAQLDRQVLAEDRERRA